MNFCIFLFVCECAIMNLFSHINTLSLSLSLSPAPFECCSPCELDTLLVIGCALMGVARFA
jgi:hypothetical protein